MLVVLRILLDVQKQVHSKQMDPTCTQLQHSLDERRSVNKLIKALKGAAWRILGKCFKDCRGVLHHNNHSEKNGHVELAGPFEVKALAHSIKRAARMLIQLEAHSTQRGVQPVQIDLRLSLSMRHKALVRRSEEAV